MGTCGGRSAEGRWIVVGGASRDRTGDLYNAIVALSQLSYGPNFFRRGSLGTGLGWVNFFDTLQSGAAAPPQSSIRPRNCAHVGLQSMRRISTKRVRLWPIANANHRILRKKTTLPDKSPKSLARAGDRS